MQYQDLLQIFPYNDEIYRVFVNGEQLKRMVRHILRDEAFEGEHTEFYQFSRGFRIEYDREKKDLISLSLNEYEIRVLISSSWGCAEGQAHSEQA